MDEIWQSPTTMSTLYVLQTFPSQKKEFLSTLGTIDSLGCSLMTFNLDKSAPWLLSIVTINTYVTIRSLIIHWCITNDGACTYVMSTKNWKELKSQELVPSTTINLREYDGSHSQSKGLYQNAPIKVPKKKMIIYVDVVKFPTQLQHYVRWSFMYAMKVVKSSIFHVMISHYDKKMVTINQLTYQELISNVYIGNVISTIQKLPPISTEVLLRAFKDSTLLGTYHGTPKGSMCIISMKEEPFSLMHSSQSPSLPDAP